MPNLKGWEWLIIVALILLLFGAKRLPDAARGLGRSLRIFKAETKGMTGEAGAEESAEAPAVEAAAADPVLPPAQESSSPDSVPTEQRES